MSVAHTHVFSKTTLISGSLFFMDYSYALLYRPAFSVQKIKAKTKGN